MRCTTNIETLNMIYMFHAMQEEDTPTRTSRNHTSRWKRGFILISFWFIIKLMMNILAYWLRGQGDSFVLFLKEKDDSYTTRKIIFRNWKIFFPENQLLNLSQGKLNFFSRKTQFRFTFLYISTINKYLR